MTNAHDHSWQHLNGSKFVCRFKECQVVSDLSTIVSNLRKDTELKTKIKVLSDQLYKGHLKKDARDEAYAWVRANTSEETVIEPKENQGALL